MHLEFIRGDVREPGGDAIVNAANCSQPGMGRRWGDTPAAGPELPEACRRS